MSCTRVLPLAEPPAISPNIQYLVGVTPEGETVMMERPIDGAVVVFDGDKYGTVTGGADDPFKLAALQIADPLIGYSGVVYVDVNGVLFRARNDTNQEFVLTSMNGTVQLKKLADSGVPATGTGYLSRTSEDGGTIAFLNGGIMNTIGGEPTVIPYGDIGETLVMRMRGAIPTPTPVFEAPASGNIAQGSGIATLEAVEGKALGTHDVEVMIPSMKLTDGTNEITIANVNIHIITSNPAGLNGPDVSSISADKWYYIYVISDGTNVAGIFSLDPNIPVLTNAPGYTYYGFISLFRSDSGGLVVDFIQKGRRFNTRRINILTLASCTASFTLANSILWPTVVPPVVKTVSGVVGGDQASGSSTTPRTMVVASNINGIGYQVVGSRENSGSLDGFKLDTGTFRDVMIEIPSAPAIAWKSNTSTAGRKMDITGYTI